MHIFFVAVRVFAVLALFLGIAYPLLITTLGRVFFPEKASGSMLLCDGRIVGSSLIGQNFTSKKYFHGRVSAIDYDATKSGGSNLAISEGVLQDSVKKRIQAVRASYKLKEDQQLPADMVLASASGLDPHISVENALLQLKRIAKVRNLSETLVKELIYQNLDSVFTKMWGEVGVNVLRLNLALDNLRNEKR